MRRDELIPFKAVVEEVGMSRASIWRASQCAIPGFPKPIVVRRRVFWKKADLSALEDALFRYNGRVAFERQRDAAHKLAALQRAKLGASRRRARRVAPTAQQSLFD